MFLAFGLGVMVLLFQAVGALSAWWIFAVPAVYIGWLGLELYGVARDSLEEDERYD